MSKVIILLAFFSFPALVHANDCYIPKTKVAIAFFNGVLTPPKAAEKNRLIIESQFDVHTELFYNQTEGPVTDLIEVFNQRAAEYKKLAETDPTPKNKMAAAVMDETMIYNFVYMHREEIDATYPALKGVPISGFVARGFFRVMSKWITPQTIPDYIEHAYIARSLLSSSQRVIFLAHSQGNLFANHAYENLNYEQQKRISVIHVAPASIIRHGEYVLSDRDLVINELPHHPAPNISMAIYNSDSFGHSLIDVYLAEASTSLIKITELVKSATPTKHERGIYGHYVIPPKAGVPNAKPLNIYFTGEKATYQTDFCNNELTYASGTKWTGKSRAIPGVGLNSLCKMPTSHSNISDVSRGEIAVVSLSQTWEKIWGFFMLRFKDKGSNRMECSI